MAVKLPLRLHFNPTGDMRAAARACEAEVFLNAYGNTLAQLGEEYGPYEDSSVFIALSDDTSDVIGVMRLILPNPAGFKTLNDASRPPWEVDGYRSARAADIDIDRTWDVATLGVRSGIRGARLLSASALYYGLSNAIRANNIRSILMTLDERVRTLLSSIGLATQALPGTAPGPYLGSEASTPVYSHYGPMLDLQMRTNPEAHRLVVQGIGMENVISPPLDQWRLQPVVIPQPAQPVMLESA